MKTEIIQYVMTTVHCSCGKLVRHALDQGRELNVEICAQCTVLQRASTKVVDTGGRVRASAAPREGREGCSELG